MKNEGLKELGKSFYNLANLILVLFLLNTYMQKEDFNIYGVIFGIQGIISLYIAGYFFINKGDKNA